MCMCKNMKQSLEFLWDQNEIPIEFKQWWKKFVKWAQTSPYTQTYNIVEQALMGLQSPEFMASHITGNSPDCSTACLS